MSKGEWCAGQAVFLSVAGIGGVFESGGRSTRIHRCRQPDIVFANLFRDFKNECRLYCGKTKRGIDMSSRAVVLFSGYNDRAVLAFIRTLSDLGVDYYVVACNKFDPIFKTTYCTHVAATRKEKTLDEDEIKGILRYIAGKSQKELLIAPSTEALNRFLLEKVQVLEELGCIVPLAEKKLYETVSDKKPFSELCKAYDIRVPFEYLDPASAPAPFVAKPKSYFDSFGNTLSPVLIYNDKERGAFLRNSVTESYYYQEFVEGCSYYLLYYVSRHGEVFKLSQENLIQQPGGKSIVAAIISDLHCSPVSEKFESMLVDQGFHGLIMIEVRGHRDDLCMIEANPRFWGPSQLFVDSSFNLFVPFLVDYGLVTQAAMRRLNKKVEKTRYFWAGGISKRHELDYHNYSSSQLDVEYDAWSSCDIYQRPDLLDH